jgi:nucleotidyltransferase substrate binding protein (TIGR01987 family)
VGFFCGFRKPLQPNNPRPGQRAAACEIRKKAQTGLAEGLGTAFPQKGVPNIIRQNGHAPVNAPGLHRGTIGGTLQAMNDTRWEQRFDNYLRAFRTLAAAVELSRTRSLSELEQQGLIQGFEFTHELAWNVLKDYLENQGITGLIGSRDATRMAFKNNLIENGDAWMDMIKDRNKTSHTYDLAVAGEVVGNILARFYPAFAALTTRFTAIRNQEDGET